MQVLVHDALTVRRQQMPPLAWAQRFAAPATHLDDLLAQFGPGAVADALAPALPRGAPVPGVVVDVDGPHLVAVDADDEQPADGPAEAPDLHSIGNAAGTTGYRYKE
jgi:hypothetical protein